jgi:hypothetical protein
MIAAIDAMSETEYQMLDAALSLDPPADDKTDIMVRRRASCDMLMRDDVFAHFVKLNAGMQQALRLYAGQSCGSWGPVRPGVVRTSLNEVAVLLDCH